MQRTCPVWTALHPLQQNLDEPLLLCAVAGKLVTLTSKLVELAIRLEAQYPKFWVTAMIDQVEEVDEDGFEDLMEVSNAQEST